MNPRRLAVFAVLSFWMSTTGASRAFADCDNGATAGWFMLNRSCYVPLQLGMDTVTVSISGVPFQKARCRLPDPPYGTVVGEDWFFPHAGDRTNGMEMDIGSCTSAASRRHFARGRKRT